MPRLAQQAHALEWKAYGLGGEARAKILALSPKLNISELSQSLPFLSCGSWCHLW